MSAPTMKWRPHAIEALGLELQVVDGPPLAEGTADGRTWLVQTSGPAQLAVRSAPGLDLEAWRALHGPPRRASFGVVAQTSVCGREALRQEVTVEEEPPAVGSYPGEGGGIGHFEASFPRSVHVAVAVELDGVPVIAVWSVDAERRDTLRGDEAHFFSSLSCR
jgi:hypothetical protein